MKVIKLNEEVKFPYYCIYSKKFLIKTPCVIYGLRISIGTSVKPMIGTKVSEPNPIESIISIVDNSKSMGYDTVTEFSYHYDKVGQDLKYGTTDLKTLAKAVDCFRYVYSLNRNPGIQYTMGSTFEDDFGILIVNNYDAYIKVNKIEDLDLLYKRSKGFVKKGSSRESN